MKDKKELRKEYLNRRRNLSSEEVAQKSAAIHRRLRELPEFVRADTFLVYVSSKDNEVDTIDVIRQLLRDEKNVLVPIAQKDRSIVWSKIASLDELAPSRFGILEPPPDRQRPVTPPDDAVALVPGIAFNPEGYRIGYGGGYYDRFLATFKGSTIGLAFDVQIIPELTPDPHDIPVKRIITESEIRL